jgi:hypothetical protein
METGHHVEDSHINSWQRTQIFLVALFQAQAVGLQLRRAQRFVRFISKTVSTKYTNRIATQTIDSISFQER